MRNSFSLVLVCVGTLAMHHAALSPRASAQSRPTAASSESQSDYSTGQYPADKPLTGDYANESAYETLSKRRYVAEYQAGGLYRQPVAIEFIDSSRAWISTKRTGQIFEFDLLDRSLRVAHQDEDCSWGDIVKLTDNTIAVAEHRSGRVVIFQQRQEDWHIVHWLNAPGHPNAIVWDSDNRLLYATGLWSQRLYRWRWDDINGLESPDAWSELDHVDLPMGGGEVLLLPKHRSALIVDAFGRDYVMLDLQAERLVKHGKLYGHNVTGLVATDDEQTVLFPHQLLNEFIQTVRGDITWGGLLSNNLRWLQTDRLLSASGDEIFRKGRFYPLGAPGNGAGDPSSLSLASSGRIAVTLGGTNRVAIGVEGEHYFRQVDVGFRPVDCQFSPDEKQLVVVNQFSDSLSLVDLESFDVDHVTLGSLRRPTAAERGEQLFFNSLLSHDGWMSCHSCHSRGHTNGQLNDNLTDHTFGTPKRILSLLGQAETMPYSWGGSMQTLEEQITHSIRSTMASDDDVDPRVVGDIAAFVRSLPEPPSLLAARQGTDDRWSATLEDHYQRGQELFSSLGCADCHGGTRFTSVETFDVGLVDEQSMRLFNPPSLISVSQRQNALFHDGSSQSLRDVVEKQKHQLPRELSMEERDALVTFLERL